MSVLEQAFRDLVIANRILAHQGVVDAYGHVSIRHPTNPERFLLSRSRSPELVEEKDIMEFSLDGKPIGDDRRPPYLERFIHGASSMGAHIPVWDIAEKFGDNTNLLVINQDQGRDLAKRVGAGRIALM